MSKKLKFEMQDGSILIRQYDVDDYHNLSRGTTGQRIHRGWTVDECARGYRTRVPYRFEMPDGSILTKPSEVDNYHGLKQGRTIHRLHFDNWSVEECALNKRLKPEKHIFYMPDGSVLTRCKDVDSYHGLLEGTTSGRLCQGWSEERCANNDFKRVRVSHTFNMPDGSVLTKCKEVDRYHGFSLGTTSCRLYDGWTEDECALNKRLSTQSKYRFEMPDGSVLKMCIDVDKYYKLPRGTTSNRIRYGWSIEDCASNSGHKRHRRFIFNMPNGDILRSTKAVDKYYDLRHGKTYYRLKSGWTKEECALNKRVETEVVI